MDMQSAFKLISTYIDSHLSDKLIKQLTYYIHYFFILKRCNNKKLVFQCPNKSQVFVQHKVSHGKKISTRRHNLGGMKRSDWQTFN